MIKNEFHDQKLIREWKDLIEAKSVEGIDVGKLNTRMEEYTTAVVLENTKKELKTVVPSLIREGILKEDTPNNRAGDVGGLPQLLMPIVRRKMAKMVSKDFLGVQPMKQSSAAIFALYHHYNPTGDEAGGTDYPNYTFAGVKSDGTKGADANPLPTDITLDPWDAAGYTVGGPGNTPLFEEDVAAHMNLTIERTNVDAKSMALRATISPEAIQDMQDYHGLSMEREVETMLTNELTREVDTLLSRLTKFVAKHGAQTGTATAGTVDLNADTDGRWHREKIEVLLNYIGREAHQIFMDVRRGLGNFLHVSPSLAIALMAYGHLNPSGGEIDPANSNELGSVRYVGTLNGMFKVYVDPWIAQDFFLVGYYGGPTDAGLYYAPYVPVSVYKATDPRSFATAIGFKSRFGLVQSPFVKDNTGQPLGQNLVNQSNPYYRIVKVANL